MSNISWVVGSRVSSTLLEIIEKARDISRARGETLAAVLICPKAEPDDARAMASAGAQLIYHVPLDSDDINSEQAAVDCLAARAARDVPHFILFESSVFSCSAAPRLAARLGCGINADCTGLELDGNGELMQIRPAFGGRRIAYNVSLGQTTVATVRRGVFHRTFGGMGEPVGIETLPVKAGEAEWMLRSVLGDEGGRLDLTGADIIVSGGAGLGSRENFRKLYMLADNIGAQVGASRAAVAAGFAGYEHQVGQTGLSVRPDIYLAFGISGAVQHLSGITGAKHIFAVNKDPRAPIHEYSDLSVTADCVEVLDKLIKATTK